jgi:hypothetical protein
MERVFLLLLFASAAVSAGLALYVMVTVLLR